MIKQMVVFAVITQALLYNPCEAQHAHEMLGILGDIPDAHAEAVASLDLKGPVPKYPGSVSDQKIDPKAAENLGILLSEAMLFGRGSRLIYNEPKGGSLFARDALGGAMDPEMDRLAPTSKKPVYLFLSEELEFVVKSNNSSFGGSGNTTTTTLNYLQLPVLINYLYPLHNNTAALHGGIGVYFAYALSGKFKNSGQTQTVHLGSSSTDDFKRSDFGAAINLGYHISKNWDVFVNYDLGIKNLSNQTPDSKIHIRGFSLNIGYSLF